MHVAYFSHTHVDNSVTLYVTGYIFSSNKYLFRNTWTAPDLKIYIIDFNLL